MLRALLFQPMHIRGEGPLYTNRLFSPRHLTLVHSLETGQGALPLSVFDEPVAAVTAGVHWVSHQLAGNNITEQGEHIAEFSLFHVTIYVRDVQVLTLRHKFIFIVHTVRTRDRTVLTSRCIEGSVFRAHNSDQSVDVLGDSGVEVETISVELVVVILFTCASLPNAEALLGYLLTVYVDAAVELHAYLSRERLE